MDAVTRQEFAELAARVAKLELSLQPVEELAREVTVTAAPGDGSVQVSWTVTEAESVQSFLVGRDGSDTSGTGAWSATEGPGVRGRLFGKLRPEEYTFVVAATYADGEVVTGTATAAPLKPDVVTPGPGGGSRDRLSGLPWESGAFTEFSAAKAAEFAEARGADLDHVAVFTTRDKGWPGQLNDWWKSAVPKGAGITMGLPLWPQGGSPGATADGRDDDNWRTLARQIAAVDDDAWVRLAWEMNIGQYWKITAANRGVWVRAWRRAAEMMLAVAPNLRIGWNPNAGRDQTGVDTRAVFSEVSDLCAWVGPDSYDAWPALTNDGALAVHQGYLGEYLALARKHDIGFACPEWGVASGSQWRGNQGGDNARYIQAYVDFFAANAGDVAFESYFSEQQAYLRSDWASNPKAATAYAQRVAANLVA